MRKIADELILRGNDKEIAHGKGMLRVLKAVEEILDVEESGALSDGDVVDVAAVGGGVTAANVVAQMGATIDAIPSSVYGAEDLTVYVSPNVYRAYVRALGGFATNIGGAGTDDKGTQWFNGGGLTFDGITVALAQGMSANKMVAAEKSNLFFGTGLISDQNEVKVIDMAEIDGSQNVRVVMRFTAGIQHAIGSDVVLYS